MTTKAPAAVKQAPAESLEHLAYASVEGILTEEPHDRDRLGYTIFRWLTDRQDPLETVVRAARIRMQIGEEEALNRIRKFLTERGVKV